jgi:DNA-binding XRE family transcriptional regulator
MPVSGVRYAARVRDTKPSRFRMRRRFLGMSQGTLAKALGVSFQCAGQIENDSAQNQRNGTLAA